MLNQYFTILTEAAYQHDATIFNMAGDALLIGFNVPFPQEDAAVRAWLRGVEGDAFVPVALEWVKAHGLQTGGYRHLHVASDPRQRRVAALHQLHHHRQYGEHGCAPDAACGAERSGWCVARCSGGNPRRDS